MQYPLDLDTKKGGTISFTPFKWILLGRGQSMTSEKKAGYGINIILPVQSDLTFSESENWGEQVGANIIGGLTKEKVKQLGSAGLQKLEDSIIAKIGQSVALANARNKRGYISNDYTALTYSGVALFENNFTFSFMPQSKQEANVIAKIIYTFRYHALPKFDGAFLDYPDIWDIDVKMSDTRIGRYPYCVITNVSTNFNPDGQVHISTDGFPMRIDLTLNIKNITMTDRNDFKNHLNDFGANGERINESGNNSR